MGWRGTGLTEEQGTFVERVVPDVEVLADDSWGLLDTQVLHVRGRDGERTVKACGPENTHFPRELHAHRHWTAELVRTGHTSALLTVDEGHRVLVLDRVPGTWRSGRPTPSIPTCTDRPGHCSVACTTSTASATTRTPTGAPEGPRRTRPSAPDRSRRG